MSSAGVPNESEISLNNLVSKSCLASNSQQTNALQHASGDTGDFNGDKNCQDMNKTNLIVNYLPPSMSQEEVRALFSSIGDVESCKLVRDKTTGESLGYAFVKFARSQDAERGINTLNGLRLQNKTIKVSLARPSSESIKGANLYICGLPKKMNQPELEQLFEQCGKIITARILYEIKSGLSRGVAFIRFDQRCQAEEAIRKFHGFIPEGGIEPITVKFANSPSSTRQESVGIPAIFKQSVSTSPSRSLLSPIQQLASMSRLATKYPTGMDILPAAMAASNPLLAPAVAASSGALTPTGWCIFVYNLSPEMEDAGLWQLFGPFGAVQSVKLIRDPATNKCKGFGFVTMSNYEEALLAIQSLNGFTLGTRVLQVSFKTNPTPKTKVASTSPPSSPVPNISNIEIPGTTHTV